MDKELVLDWNELAAEALNIHTNPGHDTRRFAIVQIAIHNALNSIEPRYRLYFNPSTKEKPNPLTPPTLPIGKEKTDPPEGIRSRIRNEILVPCMAEKISSAGDPNTSAEPDPAAAVNSAAYVALNWAINDISTYQDKLKAEGLPDSKYPNGDLFDATKWYKKVGDLYTEKMALRPDGKAKYNGCKLGAISANAIITNRENDGSSGGDIRSEWPEDGTADGIFRANYYGMPPPADKNKLMVYFGEVKTFAIKTADQFRQDLNDPNYTPSERAADYDEVKLKGDKKYSLPEPKPADFLSKKDKIDYWANLNQHIVWNNFAAEIIKPKNMDALTTARLFALIHTAMADGAISMFKDVYHFKHWRPATAINKELNGHPITDPKWTAYKITPRVPEYPSTFGILGGAVGEILKRFFNSDDINQIDLSPTISYNKISEAVDDNALLKIYCGWNFRKTAVDSIIQGRLIGQYVLANQFTRIRIPEMDRSWPPVFSRIYIKIERLYEGLKRQISGR